MVFIRPYIMYQADGYQKLTDDRYEQMSKRRQAARMPDHWILPNDDKDKALPRPSRDKVPAVERRRLRPPPAPLRLPAPRQQHLLPIASSTAVTQTPSIAAPRAACPTPSPRRRAWC